MVRKSEYCPYLGHSEMALDMLMMPELADTVYTIMETNIRNFFLYFSFCIVMEDVY